LNCIQKKIELKNKSKRWFAWLIFKMCMKSHKALRFQ
jgi:hypothetical protein